jgi:NADH:ubiquinone oxidoreductase subunit B-like Fe-S oxidoreductase
MAAVIRSRDDGGKPVPSILGLGSSTPPATRIWRLQFGPCWCRSIPTEGSSFDFVRMRTTAAELGPLEDNLLIVSDRVITGAARMYRQIYADVPDPKLVIGTSSCPSADRFWDDLPGGWSPASDVIPLDLHVDECITGSPESLLAAVLAHLFATERSRGDIRPSGAVRLRAGATGTATR